MCNKLIEVWLFRFVARSEKFRFTHDGALRHHHPAGQQDVAWNSPNPVHKDQDSFPWPDRLPESFQTDDDISLSSWTDDRKVRRNHQAGQGLPNLKGQSIMMLLCLL